MVIWLIFALLPVPSLADSSIDLIRYLGTNGSFGKHALQLDCPGKGAKCTLRETNNGRAVATKEIPLADGKKVVAGFFASAGEIEAYESKNPALHWSVVNGEKSLEGQVSRSPSPKDKGPAILMKLELQLKSRLR